MLGFFVHLRGRLSDLIHQTKSGREKRVDAIWSMGQIQICVSAKKGPLSVSVSDNVISLLPSSAQRLFTPRLRRNVANDSKMKIP